MKSIITAITLTVLVFASKASGNLPSYKVSATGSKTFVLDLINVNDIVLYSIVDDKGSVLHSEEISTESYKKQYNLEALPNGEYQIVLESTRKTEIVPISIKTNSPITVGTAIERHYKPSIVHEGEMVAIYLIAPQPEEVAVKIYNQSDELICEETIRGENVLTRKFNFSQVPSGDYKINLWSNEELHSESVTIE